MRIIKIICILASLFLASCQEVTFPDHSPCALVILSDALPVQFWLPDCDTYNETVPKGVHEKCFCHPWQCADVIPVQFQEHISPDEDYTLVAIDSDNQILGSSLFSEIESGVFEASFIPNNYGICDQDIALIIYNGIVGEILSNPDFDVSLSPWVSVAGGGEDWAWVSPSQADVVLLSAGSFFSDPLRQDFNEHQAGTYEFIINVENDPNVGSISLNVSVYIGAVLVVNIASVGFDHQTPTTLTFSDIVIPDAFDRIQISVSNSGVAGAQTVRIYSASLNLQSIDPILHPHSDCLNIATIQDETELFEYSNERNFAGLVYADISPDASFNIRVPCRFFHEQFPEEDEAIELTSSVITTSAQMKSQKLLEVKHAPYYFHKKLQLILKHQTLTNNDKSWKKEEKYEINPGNKQWPLKSATCLLTEKNSVLRNVL